MTSVVVEGIEVEPASSEDVPAIEALLAASGLPLDGAAAAFEHGIVARDGSALVGAAAVEMYGEAGLLRSVAVAGDRRGSGLGQRLVAAAEELARREGVRELYLLTETAIDYFPRLGYAAVQRADVPAPVAASAEFAVACPSSAVAMRRALGTEDAIAASSVVQHATGRPR